MTPSPKVSVLCLAYNQKNYITAALEGFVSQKTNFDFEVLVNDDASNDGTAEIIKKYAEKYPALIKPVFHAENQYSKGIRGLLARNLLPIAKGAYIALCEGDDFFTDENKLQLQADYLDRNPDCSLCFHPVRVFFEGNEMPAYIFPAKRHASAYNVKELIRHNFIQTNSVMYRRQAYGELPVNILPGDWYLHLYHAKYGSIGFIDRVMSAYRRHAGGIWWEAENDFGKFLEKHGPAHLAMYVEAYKLYGDKPEYRDILLEKISYIKSEQEYISGKTGAKYPASAMPPGLIDGLEKYGKDPARLLKLRSYRGLYRFLREAYFLLKRVRGGILKSIAVKKQGQRYDEQKKPGKER